MKSSSIVKDQLSTNDDIGVLVPKPSPILASPVSSQSPSIPSEGILLFFFILIFLLCLGCLIIIFFNFRELFSIGGFNFWFSCQ